MNGNRVVFGFLWVAFGSLFYNGYAQPSFAQGLSACHHLLHPDAPVSYWDSLSMDVTVRKTSQAHIGVLLNYADSTDFHFLSIRPFGDKPSMVLGRQQYGRLRLIQQVEFAGTLQDGHDYRLKLLRAPWVDPTHWMQWKVELVDLSSGTLLVRETLENTMPFFGMGKTGSFSDSPDVQFIAFRKFPECQESLGKQSLLPVALFGDGMVLQRHKPIPVWGSAQPGATIKVSLAGREAHSFVKDDGKWMVELPAMQAASNLTMHIRCGDQEVVVSDVAIGEVWLASGQSNMEMRAWQSDVANRLDTASDLTGIRFFMQQQWPSANPVGEPGGKWYTGDPAIAPGWSAAALSFAIHLKQALGVPVGVLQATWGGTGIESWLPMPALRAIPQVEPLLDRYGQYSDILRQGELVETVWPWSWDVPGQSHAPSYLYNGMIHPLRHYSVRGILWYQGESNCHRSSKYAPLLQGLLNSWRAAWQDDSLFFIGVQLAGYDGRQSGNELAGAWPLLRDAQRRVLGADPRALLVSAFDLGDSLDIHPPLKWELGQRMGRAATYLIVGKTEGSFSGPDLARVNFKGKVAEVTFRKGAAEFTSELPAINGFEVAGTDRRFYPATATRLRSGRIKLTAAAVPIIVAVRFGWENYPVKANLRNSDGLLAVPFRTDDWEVADQYSY